MAQEAVSIIKKAEDDAKNIISQADVKAHAIITDAKAARDNTLDNLNRELKLALSEAITAAKEQAQSISDQNLNQSRDEAQKLISDLSSKKQAAVALVLEEILKN